MNKSKKFLEKYYKKKCKKGGTKSILKSTSTISHPVNKTIKKLHFKPDVPSRYASDMAYRPHSLSRTSIIRRINKQPSEKSKNIANSIANIHASDIYMSLNEKQTLGIENILNSIKRNKKGYEYDNKDIIEKKILSVIKGDSTLTINDIILTNKILKILYPHIDIPDYLLGEDTEEDTEEEEQEEESNNKNEIQENSIGGNKNKKSNKHYKKSNKHYKKSNKHYKKSNKHYKK
jgi:hypothetical protein